MKGDDAVGLRVGRGASRNVSCVNITFGARARVFL